MLQVNAHRSKKKDIGSGRRALPGGAPTGLCSKPGKQGVGEADMTEALSLGTSFMLQSQQKSGRFSYEFNWKLGIDPSEQGEESVSAVREAGATWALSFIGLEMHQSGDDLPPQLIAAIRKSLDFFERHSQTTEKGLRLVAYPGLENEPGDTGTLAILALANIDYLRTQLADEQEREHRLKFLKSLLLSLRSAITEDGLVHRSYSLKDGSFSKPHTPYFDGETLLAMIKAAKYLGLTEFWPDVHRLANAGWKENVREGLKEGRDLPDMKSYYQWSSMAWYELLSSEHAEMYNDFRLRLVNYGLWMVQVHKVNEKNLNTGYAFEGLIPAFQVAREAGLKDAQDVLGCAIYEGMRHVTGMQLGHSLAAGLAAKAPALERTKGGVQNSLTEPALRIDTTQHQMHAVIMMKRMLSGYELI